MAKYPTLGPMLDQPMAFNPNNNLYLVTSPSDVTQFVRSINSPFDGRYSATIGPDTSAVATQPGQPGVYIARHENVNYYSDISGLTDLLRFPYPDLRINSLAFTPAGRYYAVEDRNDTLTVHGPSGSLLKQIAVNRPRVVTIPSPTVRVTIDSSPAGQSFKLEGDGCPAYDRYSNHVTPRSLSWRPGSSCTVSFNSLPAAGTRQVFKNWTNGSSSRTIDTPEVDTTYTATFQTQYELTASSNPGGSGSIAGTGYYDAGSSASITATPAPGFDYRFLNWTGPVASPSSASNTVVMNAPVAVTSNFQLNTYTLAGSVSGQYSDPVTLRAIVGPGGAVFSGALQFQVDGANAGAAIPVSGSGEYTSNYPVRLPAGPHSITATLTSSSPIASGSSGSGTLIVKKEDMVIAPAPAPINPQMVTVSTPGVVANSITLTAKLKSGDGSPGDFGLATPTVTLVPAGTGTIACSVSNAVSTATLTAVCQNVPVGAYTVRWQITGEYYTAPTVNTVLAVYDPSQPFVAGAGRVPRNGGWADFAVSVKYGSPVPAGGIVYVEPSSAGDTVVASTSIRTVQRLDATKFLMDGRATINGAGGSDFVAIVTDKGSPGINRDLFGLQVVGSEVRFPEVPLTQGEIVVR